VKGSALFLNPKDSSSLMAQEGGFVSHEKVFYRPFFTITALEVGRIKKRITLSEDSDCDTIRPE
jgi:hypothetical protein